MKKLLIMLILFTVSSYTWAGTISCDAGMDETYVAWPTVDPVWEMCFLKPSDSSSIDGSSLEIRNVHFNGYMVFERAHMPMLFAQYQGGLCYRDWKDDDSDFIEAKGGTGVGGVENPTDPAITTCDASTDTVQPVGSCPFGLDGYTAGDCFSGVQVEKYDTYMVLTTNHAAAWYKYSSRFIFHEDGRIQPRFGFGNSSGTNNGTTHWHHGYWRMNFDIDGTDNDQVFIIDNNGETLQNTEFSDLRETQGSPTAPQWMVKDSVTGRGYRIEPGASGVSQAGDVNDYEVPTDPSGAGHHEVDVMATKYKVVGGFIEYSDTPSSNNLGECEMYEENLVGTPGNGESLVGEDVVFWYRSAVNDIAPVGMLCKTGGPTLHPVGNWGVVDPDVIFEHGFE
ncbi:MAG: hypothetical protein ACSHWU_06400 [Marinicella sp.]